MTLLVPALAFGPKNIIQSNNRPVSPTALIYLFRLCGLFFFFVGFFSFFGLLFLFSSFLFFHPRSSVRVSGVCGVTSWAFPVVLLCRLFWRPLSGLPPLSCILYVCTLFPSLLLAYFRLGSFAGCG